MPTLTGTKAELSKCPKCGKLLKTDVLRFSARCECGFGATYGKLPNGKYYLVWVNDKSQVWEND